MNPTLKSAARVNFALASLRILPSERLLSHSRMFVAQIRFLFFVLLVSRVNVCAQDVDREPDLPPLLQGTIVFDGGTELRCQMRYYDKERIAALDEEGNQNFLGPADVERFEIFDPEFGLRKFLTLPLKEYKTSPERFFFFEVLLELETFAVLSSLERLRHNPRPGFMEQIPVIQANPMGGGNFVTSPANRNVLETFSENLYLIDNNGAMELYLVTRYDHLQGIFRKRHNANIEQLNLEVIRKHTGSHYKSLKKFASENSLSFKTREGLIKILEEYGRLSDKSIGETIR